MTPADEAEREIAELVAREAASWFPGTPSGPVVHLRPLGIRPRSRVYAVALGEPDAPPLIVAKLRTPAPSVVGRGGARRPTLAPYLVDEDELTRREFDGLHHLAATFADGDPRFGAIRPLAHLPARHAILMQFVRGRPMKELVVRASRLPTGRHRRRSVPDPVLVGVGAWLRRFHDATPTASCPSRQATGRDVVAHFAALEDYLGRRLGRRFGGLAGAGSGLAAELLPAGALPLAVGHGDFAPRNVLVDDDGRVVVIDPLMRWAVPAQEDLCRFLVGLQLLGLQLHSHGAAYGAATLEHWEHLLIQGYYGDRVPVGALRCYQLLILLDKWSALVETAGAPSAQARVRRWSQQAASGYVRSQAERLLRLARSADR